jgi:hypothetical protein
MKGLTRWYDREYSPYGADRNTVEEYANWLKLVNWRLFCAFTFPFLVSDQQAVKAFDDFIDRLEKNVRCDVGYVRGDEKRFSGCGNPACPRHFHALLTCVRPVAPEFVEALWSSKVGRRSDGDSAQVKPYDPNLKGVSYVLKYINHPNGDWAFRKMHLFLPSTLEEGINKRMRRHLRRHPALEKFKQGQVAGAWS